MRGPTRPRPSRTPRTGSAADAATCRTPRTAGAGARPAPRRRRARRSAPWDWEAGARSSVQPEHDDAAVAEVAPPGDQPELGARDLRGLGLAAQLAHRFDHVVHAPHV